MIVIYEIFRWFGLLTGWPVQLLFFKRKIYYENRKVQGRIVRGGAMIISNHYNVLDYVSNVFVFAFRKLHVIYAKTPSKWAILGMNFFGGIPVDRRSFHMDFMRKTVKLMKRGKLVQIYPEARIPKDGHMLPFKPSYIYMALEAGVPIIPVVIDGNYGVFRRTHVIMGTPIDPAQYCSSIHPHHDEINALNDMIYAKCLSLQEELYRRIENDHARKHKQRKNSRKDK